MPFAIIALSVLSGILYRFGGAEKRGDWWDWARKSITRDLGCSLVTTTAIGLWLGWPNDWWMYVLHFGLLWGALSTYWDFLNGGEEVWWTWLITGFFYGLSALSFLGSVGLWVVLLRAGVVAVTTMMWRMVHRPSDLPDDVMDEFGVGFLLTLSVMML